LGAEYSDKTAKGHNIPKREIYRIYRIISAPWKLNTDRTDIHEKPKRYGKP
jgi:hypothetical protein